MTDQSQLQQLRQGIDAWNQWRQEHPDIEKPDFNGVDLSGADLSGVDFIGADLSDALLNGTTLNGAILVGTNLNGAILNRAELVGAMLSEATLIGADLSEATLNGAILYRANLSMACLVESNFYRADLSEAILDEADLRGANLSWANLSEARLRGAELTGCRVYAISAWNVDLQDARQGGLIITPQKELTITVDNLEVAQFIYLLLNNQRIRHVFHTITTKLVLILGRFTPERKVVLDGLKSELRKNDYLPVVFDFERPVNRDLTATVSMLAHLARFIIADLTDPSSVPHELYAIAPHCLVPVQPLLLWDEARYEYAMFQDLRERYHWVLPIYRYLSTESLCASLSEYVILPAEQKAQELELRKYSI